MKIDKYFFVEDDIMARSQATMGKCEDCKRRIGRIKFSETPMMTLTHGWGYTVVCRQCYIKRLEETIKNIKLNIDRQKRMIKHGK